MQSEDFLHESNMQPRSQSKLSKLQFNPQIPQIPQIPQNEPFRGGHRPPSQRKRNPFSEVSGTGGRCPPLNNRSQS